MYDVSHCFYIAVNGLTFHAPMTKVKIFFLIAGKMGMRLTWRGALKTIICKDNIHNIFFWARVLLSHFRTGKSLSANLNLETEISVYEVFC